MIAKQNLSAIRADEQEVADPGMAGVVQTVESCIFFCQSTLFEGPRSVVTQLVVLVAVLAEN